MNKKERVKKIRDILFYYRGYLPDKLEDFTEKDWAVYDYNFVEKIEKIYKNPINK